MIASRLYNKVESSKWNSFTVCYNLQPYYFWTLNDSLRPPLLRLSRTLVPFFSNRHFRSRVISSSSSFSALDVHHYICERTFDCESWLRLVIQSTATGSCLPIALATYNNPSDPHPFSPFITDDLQSRLVDQSANLYRNHVPIRRFNHSRSAPPSFAATSGLACHSIAHRTRRQMVNHKQTLLARLSL
jgi:hypothetical protein